MIKIGIFGKVLHEKDLLFFREFIDLLYTKENVELWINESFYHKIAPGCVQFQHPPLLFADKIPLKESLDFVFSLGGDGTLLDTLGCVGKLNIPVLGINLGHLGFLTGLKQEDAKEYIMAILNGDYQVDKRILIGLQSTLPELAHAPYGLNEIVIFKKDSRSLIAIDLEVNGQFMNTFFGDGLIFATPTGSTAYSLSCGGPILLPEADNILITPVASHTLTVRPLVLPGDAKIKVILRGKEQQFNISIDSNIYSLQGEAQFLIEKKDFCISTVRLSQRCFFDNIREKLMWGLDIRK
ncbi:MAG: NAD(+)/NADH kinase [Bacteroidales bacterium]